MFKQIRTSHALLGAICLAGAIITAAPAYAQMCNCSCDLVIPPTLDVQEVYRNEGPGGPLAYVTAGRVGNRNTEVRHANEINFGAAIITHFCVNLKYPAGLPGDTAYLFIAMPNPADQNLPGAVVYEQPFTVNVNGGHQLVQLNTPLGVSGVRWAGVRYPSAKANVPHQGVGTRNQGRAAVYIGGVGGWRDYESTQSGHYVGRAPLIRPLTLVPAAGGGGGAPCKLIVAYPSNPNGMLETTELGGGATVAAVLSRAPTSTVWVQIFSTNPGEGDVTLLTLTFNPWDWDIPQTFDVYGIDDALPDGPIDYRVNFFMISGDPCYDQQPVPGINCVNLDDETGGIACGGEWTQSTPMGPTPPNLEDPAMVFDSWRNVAVMFGGHPGLFGPGETWEWDGSNWRLATVSGPSSRRGHAMAYDSFRNVTVLMGGIDAGGLELSDTWEWDGVQWMQRSAGLPNAPGGARVDHAMAFDAARGLTVLYGGDPLLSGVETWEWNGFVWQQRITPNSPGLRSMHAMTFDTRTQRVILFGGQLYSPPFFDDDVWEYDGIRWTPVFAQSATKPAVRWNTGLVHDPVRGVSILFGGESGFAMDDTWEWDGVRKRWTQILVTPFPPPARTRHAMAFDIPRGVVVVYGGSGGPGWWHSDTWKYRPTGPIGQSATRYFQINGTGSGVPFSWGIVGGNANFLTLSAAFFPGMPASGIAAQLAALISSSSCGQITAVPSPYAPNVLVVNSNSLLSYQLIFGPAGLPPACGPLPSNVCVFNPSIVELLLDGDDCNQNGIDDVLEIANDPLMDVNGNGVIDVCEAGGMPGDMNCDGVVTPGDIAGFVLALTNPTAYALQYPLCNLLNGDANGDGVVTPGDIAAFVALLTN